MDKTYVEYRDGIYRVVDTRVTLDSLVYAYWEGHSPETIAQAFWLDSRAGLWGNHVLSGASAGSRRVYTHG